ncbi:MAG TPA: DUF1491 family protein [Rhizobiaceae bacterium]|nr:DUF1491 family protein [Rhizobiaceae bacterium]
MRLTSDFEVAALVRKVFADGGFAAIEKRGATEAGAIYIRCRTRLGEYLLYGPAAQSDYGEASPVSRLYGLILRTEAADELDARLARESRFDPDLWVVEIEVEEADVARYLDLVKP